MWTVARGTYRLVIAIPTLGVAVKFPRLRINFYRKRLRRGEPLFVLTLRDVLSELRFSLSMIRENPRLMFSGAAWNWVPEYFYYETLATFRIRVHFLRAVHLNQAEYRYYRSADRAKKQLLQPTHFSFFGLVNLQEWTEPSRENDEVVYRAFKRLVGAAEAQVESHHLQFANNFADFTKGLKFLDYGSKGVQKFIEKHGLLLAEKFDIEAGRYYDKPRDLR